MRQKSWEGVDMRCSWYRAGYAETKTLERPPEAVAAVWMMLFSLGPKPPPRIGKFSAKAVEKNLMTAKPRMA